MRFRYTPNLSSNHTYAVATEFLVAILFIAALVLLRGTTPANPSATLTLDWGSQQRTFQGEIVSGMTILDALQASAAAGNISFEFTTDEDGAVKIARLDGFQQQSETLEVTVNGQNIDPATINTVLIRPSDHIIIKLSEMP